MKKSTRIFTLALVLALCLGVLAGCGGGGGEKNAAAEDSGEFPPEETVTLSFLTHAPPFAPQDPNEKPITQRIQDETNIQIDWTCYVDDQFAEKKQLALAQKKLPDAVFSADMSQYDLLRYAKDGTIIAVEDLIDEHMPNLKKVLDDNPEYRALITAPDGHIYSFPWIEELGTGKEAIQAIGGKPWINQTWLDELNLAMPTTIDELTDVLKAFRDENPEGRNNVLPMSFMLAEDNPNEGVSILLSSFGFGDNPEHYVVNNDKKVVYTLADEGIIPGFEWLNSLYEDNLIDPEVFTHDWGTYAAKGNSGRYGVCVGWDCADIATSDDYVPLPPLEGPDGNINVTRQNAMGLDVGSAVITSTNAYPILTAKYIDYMYDPMQSIQNNWGTYGDEGDNIFELTDEGTLKHLSIPEGVSPWELRCNTNLSGPLAVLSDYYGVYTTLPDDAKAIMDIVQDTYAPYMQMDYNYPPVFMNIDDQTRITQIETDLKPFVNSKRSEWIMNGNVSDEWDNYIDELEGKGITEYVELKQKGLDEYFANIN